MSICDHEDADELEKQLARLKREEMDNIEGRVWIRPRTTTATITLQPRGGMRIDSIEATRRPGDDESSRPAASSQGPSKGSESSKKEAT